MSAMSQLGVTDFHEDGFVATFSSRPTLAMIVLESSAIFRGFCG